LEKQRFHTLLNNYTSLTSEEAQVLISLEKEFPYSQVIRSLAARATHDHDLPEKEEQLHLGAIYTTDRAVFKSVMTALPQERKTQAHQDIQVESQEVIENSQVESSDEIPVNVQNTNTEVKEIRTEVQQKVENVSTDAALLVENSVPDIISPEGKVDDSIPDNSFYAELSHDLERLKELKHEFEETLKQFENGTLSAALDAGTTTLKSKGKPVDSTDELLTEIKSSKKKVKPEGPKQKEQIEIIEQFIKTQPTIKGKVASEEKALPKDDLAEKNLSYNENIISETLAQILIKQGKKEKAIEVLKKLIWKFPQKKAYFAAQIEDLKK